MPYRIVRGADGREVPSSEFFAELKAATAICVGESHTDSHHHWAQLELLSQLSDPKVGNWAMGMEMFQRPFQGVLDDFSEGRISEQELLSRSDWERRWRHDWRLYAPMVRLAVQRGVALLALNVSKELKDKWKASGKEGLSEEDQAKIPEINLNNEAHRRWFRSLMESMSEGHGTGDTSDHAFLGDPEGASPEPAVHEEAKPAAEGKAVSETAPAAAEPDFIDTIYPVQVLWDETMADTAAKWLQAGEGRKLVILAGNGHCHESAIVGRMKRRGIEGVLSVRPVVEEGQGEVGDLLSTPMNDYLFIMQGAEAAAE